MTPAARISGAIEVLSDIEARRRPAAEALKDWGLARRFAGSGDRAAIASLVYDSLRRRSSSAWLMGRDDARALVLGALRLQRGLTVDQIAGLVSGERFASSPMTEDERLALDREGLAEAPAHVAGDFPDWIAGSLDAIFGSDTVAEMRMLAMRAPLDLRVNTLLATRPDIAAELAFLAPSPTPHAPDGLRIALGEYGRGPAIHADPAFLRGAVEVQDEGSQLAARLCGARPGETVVDICAGGGGKTLALAALMQAEGRLVASDSDPRRLAPIHARLARAGIAMVDIRTPRGKLDPLADLDGQADLVVVDAPCTGTGTWRRNPDAKWRLRRGSLSGRLNDQANVLDRAVRLARPGGRIAYVTCSVLPEENDGAVSALLGRHAGLTVEPSGAVLEAAALDHLAPAVRFTQHGLQMSPYRTGTDGFYVALLRL